MIFGDDTICPDCGNELKYYDSVERIVKGKASSRRVVRIKRYQCPICSCVHRQLPDYIFPYKQYDADIIVGVIEKLITCETFGFEDYPCEMTMIRWRAQKSQLLL